MNLATVDSLLHFQDEEFSVCVRGKGQYNSTFHINSKCHTFHYFYVTQVHLSKIANELCTVYNYCFPHVNTLPLIIEQ